MSQLQHGILIFLIFLIIIRRALNKPTPPVSELKAIQEIRPEETQNFSNVTAHNETQKEVKEYIKEHIKEYNKPSPVPPIQHMKKVTI